MADDNPFAQYAQPKPDQNPFARYAKPAAPPKAFVPTSAFDADMNRSVGAGKWKSTGDYRSPAKEDALRAQGAGTAPPGHTSAHSLGTPNAPGAHDFVPEGADWNAALAAARREPGVKDAFVEGPQGGQGRHIHVDMADESGNPFFKYVSSQEKPAATEAATGSRVGSSARLRLPDKPAPARSQNGNPFTKFAKPIPPSWQDDMRRRAHESLDDYRKQASNPSLAFDPVKSVREAGDLLGAALSPVGGVVEAIAARTPDTGISDRHRLFGQISGTPPKPPSKEDRARIIGDVAEAAVPIPGAEELGAAAKGLKGLREAGTVAHDVEEASAADRAMRVGGHSEAPPGAPHAARPAATADRTLAAKTEHEDPFVFQNHALGDEANPAERVDNALYRRGGRRTSSRLQALDHMRDLPPEIRDPKVQEELTHAIERKMIDPNTPIPEHLQPAYDAWLPWSERQRTAVNKARALLASKGLSDAEVEEYAPASETGYLPRRVVGKAPGIDPLDVAERKSPLAIQQGSKGGLAKTTGSMKERGQIVLEDKNGNRTFEHRNPTNDEWKPGMTVADPRTGKPATVKHATIQEAETAGARDSHGQPIKYHKNALVNTMDEAIKAEGTVDNIKILNELTKGLQEEGLAHQHEHYFKGEDGLVNIVPHKSSRPEGFVGLPNIPQLKGWTFSPKVAEVLKDYFPGPDEPLDSVFAKVNRALNASLFLTPIPHAKNVATMGLIGRGWDWLPTIDKGFGSYGRLMRTSHMAMKEVFSLGPRYRRFLREGAGLQSGDEATRNFYQTLLDSAAKGIESDEGGTIRKATGLNPVDMAKAVYKVSHKILWQINDMVLFQRQLELEEKGMSQREAIKEAEKWIANYRIPSQVMGLRSAAQLFKSGNWIRFGRYDYGKWKAIGEMVKGMATGSPKERLDAMGKVVAAGVVMMILYPMLDGIAKMATGNKNARVSRGGELSIADAVGRPGIDWMQRVSSMINPAPAIDLAEEVRSNRDAFTGKSVVDSMASPAGKTAQVGEEAAKQFYPTDLALEGIEGKDWKKPAASLFGISDPQSAPGEMKASTRKYLTRQARKRERKDPIAMGLEALSQGATR